MNKDHLGSYFDDFILKELNEHLKALISLCMDNKRDLDYIKFKLEMLEQKSEDVNLINIKEAPKLNWPRNPGFDILSDRDE
jgi:hypothetical protein